MAATRQAMSPREPRLLRPPFLARAACASRGQWEDGVAFSSAQWQGKASLPFKECCEVTSPNRVTISSEQQLLGFEKQNEPERARRRTRAAAATAGSLTLNFPSRPSPPLPDPGPRRDALRPALQAAAKLRRQMQGSAADPRAAPQ